VLRCHHDPASKPRRTQPEPRWSEIVSVSTDALLFWGFDIDPDNGELPEDFDQWHDEKYSDLELLEERFGCSLETHQHSDYPVYIFTPTASLSKAWRGSPKEITSLTVDPKWADQLRAFCEALGVTYREPKWLLASYWG
jgi:hypothetical protein